MPLITYLLRVGSALSQLGNVVLLNGAPNESISGRSYRQRWWSEPVIDFIFGKGHCKAAYRQDTVDAYNYLVEYEPNER